MLVFHKLCCGRGWINSWFIHTPGWVFFSSSQIHEWYLSNNEIRLRIFYFCPKCYNISGLHLSPVSFRVFCWWMSLPVFLNPQKIKVNCSLLTSFTLSKKQASRLCLFSSSSSQAGVRNSGASLGGESSDTDCCEKRAKWHESLGQMLILVDSRGSSGDLF